MKKASYILSIAAVAISVWSCVVGGIIILFQKPLIHAIYGGVSGFSFPIFSVAALLKILIFSLFAAIVVFAFKKQFWPEIVLISTFFIANNIPVGLLTSWLTNCLIRSGSVALYSYSYLTNLMNVATSIASVASFIIIFVCGLSIGAKVLEKRKQLDTPEIQEV